MGDLLRFPSGRPDGAWAGTGAEPDVEPGAEPGAGGHSVPAGRPVLPVSRPTLPADAGAADQRARRLTEGEPGWAVPGVDGVLPAPREPTRMARRAEHVAMATLTRHDASEGEVRAKLVAKGLADEDVEAELDRLRRAGLVDDSAFAVRLVERLRDRKGLGDSAIRSTLRGRLVPQTIVDAVLAEQVEDAETSEARLQEVADDRARRLTSLTYPVAERRLTAYLMRRGFSGSAVRTATRTALEGVGIR